MQLARQAAPSPYAAPPSPQSAAPVHSSILDLLKATIGLSSGPWGLPVSNTSVVRLLVGGAEDEGGGVRFRLHGGVTEGIHREGQRGLLGLRASRCLYTPACPP